MNVNEPLSSRLLVVFPREQGLCCMLFFNSSTTITSYTNQPRIAFTSLSPIPSPPTLSQVDVHTQVAPMFEVLVMLGHTVYKVCCDSSRPCTITSYATTALCSLNVLVSGPINPTLSQIHRFAPENQMMFPTPASEATPRSHI